MATLRLLLIKLIQVFADSQLFENRQFFEKMVNFGDCKYNLLDAVKFLNIFGIF